MKTCCWISGSTAPKKSIQFLLFRIIKERRHTSMAKVQSEVTVAAKALAVAEGKLAKLQGRVEDSVKKAADKACTKLQGKIDAQTKAVADAKAALAKLVQ